MDLDKKLENLLLEIDIIQGRAHRIGIPGHEDAIVYTNTSDHLILGLSDPVKLMPAPIPRKEKFLSKLKKNICTIFR